MTSYWAVVSARFRELLQYRAAAVAGMTTQVFWGLIRVMIFEAFYRSSDAAQPMEIGEVATYVWLGQAFLALLPWNLDLNLRAQIRSGGVGYELLRPVDLYGYWFSRSLAWRSAPTLLRAPLLIAFALILMGMDAPPSWTSAFAFVISMAGAVLLSAALSTLFNITMLWTISADGMLGLAPALVTILSGMIVPIPLYPDWAQTALNILPFRGLVDVPSVCTWATSRRRTAHAIGAPIGVDGRDSPSRTLDTRQGPPQNGRAGRIAMLDSARLYIRYIEISLRGQMQYRASFIMLSAGHLLATFVEFVAILVLFDRFGSLRGWSLYEVAFLYGMVNVSFSIADAASRGFDTFGSMVKSGDFDRLLTRPRSTALQLAGQELTIRRVGRFAQGLAVMIWAGAAMDVGWSATDAALLMAAIAGGVCMFVGLVVIQATLAFWTTETLEIMNTVTYGGVETTQYPNRVYRPWFQRLFHVRDTTGVRQLLPGARHNRQGGSAGFAAVVPVRRSADRRRVPGGRLSVSAIRRAALSIHRKLTGLYIPYDQPSKRRNTTQAFCPPNPKLFERTVSTSAFRASLGT